MMAAWTLNLAAGKLLVALEMLLAFWAAKFEFAHNFGIWFCVMIIKRGR